MVRRSAVARTVDAGIGQWLQGVEVERLAERQRFRGWIVRKLYPGDPCYQTLDLRPGDVVTAVNGQSLETPAAAYAVAQSLKTADAIVITYLRGGETRTSTVRIVTD